ncbi:hypothetical protein BDF14DRAFT_1750655 [Spinellus fusiger]|nr:hypothetical protein BDF14DRAFT_1750655 [Spinellus fusiger]
MNLFLFLFLFTIPYKFTYMPEKIDSLKSLYVKNHSPAINTNLRQQQLKPPSQKKGRPSNKRILLPQVAQLFNSVRKLKTPNALSPEELLWINKKPPARKLFCSSFLSRIRHPISKLSRDNNPTKRLVAKKGGLFHYKKIAIKTAYRHGKATVSRVRRRNGLSGSCIKIDKQKIHEEMKKFDVPLQWRYKHLTPLNIRNDNKISSTIPFHNTVRDIEALQCLVLKEEESIQSNQKVINYYTKKLKQLEKDLKAFDSLVNYSYTEGMDGLRSTLREISENKDWTMGIEKQQKQITARIEYCGRDCGHQKLLESLEFKVQLAINNEMTRCWINDWQFCFAVMLVILVFFTFLTSKLN